MAVSAKELEPRPNPTESLLVRDVFFPQFRNFISNGKSMEDESVDLLTAEEITWLRRARLSTLHDEEVSMPEESRKRFPHLAGFSLTENA
jgi:hypothetical protein